MSRDIVWIRKPFALRVHAEQLRRHGGEDGMVNEGMLDGALDRPRTVLGYMPDASLEELAASMAVGIAKDHPFVFEDVAAGKMLEAELAQWFTENTMPPEW